MSTSGSRSEAASLMRRGKKSSSKPKVVLVRQPVHSVRPQDLPDRTPLRLTIAITAALGGLVVVWVAGHIGFRLGFAPLVRVPELSLGPTDGLAVGTMNLLALPGWLLVSNTEPGMSRLLGVVGVVAVLGPVGAWWIGLSAYERGKIVHLIGKVRRR